MIGAKALAQMQQRTCLSKQRYHTKELARLHARKIPKREGRKAKEYRCPFSTPDNPHYHAGHNLSDRRGHLKLDYSKVLHPQPS